MDQIQIINRSRQWILCLKGHKAMGRILLLPKIKVLRKPKLLPKMLILWFRNSKGLSKQSSLRINLSIKKTSLNNWIQMMSLISLWRFSMKEKLFMNKSIEIEILKLVLNWEIMTPNVFLSIKKAAKSQALNLWSEDI